MDFGLKEKVAVVGGASRGLGFACALELAKEGCRVVIAARNEKDLMNAKKEIEKKTGAKVLAVACDLSTQKGINLLFEKTLQNFRVVHILVNNSGGPKHGTNSDVTENDWNDAFEGTLLFVKRMSEKAIPIMQKQKFGRIINITSLSAKQPRPDLVLSNVFRSGVVSYTKILAKELAKGNITVNCIAPGVIETGRSRYLMELNAKKAGKSFEEFKKEFVESLPAKRILDPTELAALAVFLSSERASAISGTTIQVDGAQYSGLL